MTFFDYLNRRHYFRVLSVVREVPYSLFKKKNPELVMLTRIHAVRLSLPPLLSTWRR